MAVSWDEVTLDNLYQLEKVFKLYDKTFPKELREPHDIFLRSLKYPKNRFPNNYRLLVGFEDEQLVSFATGHYLAEVNSGFIIYIVTNPSVQSKGIGTKTLLELEKLLNKDANLAGNKTLNAIVLETEKQELAQTEAEQKECIRRNRFYERNDYQLYKEIDYIMPPLNDGGNSISLNLFIKYFQENNVTREEMKRIIQCMFQEKYYLVNKTDKNVLYNCLEKMDMANTVLLN